jgi:phage-related protein
MQGPLKISGAAPRAQVITIPGSNGGIRIYDGSYHNRTIQGSCYMLSDHEGERVATINHWLFGEEGYRKLIDDNDPTHYYLACPTAGAGLHLLGGNASGDEKLNAFSLKFDARPERFLVRGDTPLDLGLMTVNTGKKTITNPTLYDAAPIIRVTELVQSTQDGAQIWFEAPDGETSVVTMSPASNTRKSITYDTEIDYAYDDTGTLDAYVKCNEPIRLKNGDTKIWISNGQAKLEIIPRWWEL